MHNDMLGDLKCRAYIVGMHTVHTTDSAPHTLTHAQVVPSVSRAQLM